MTPRQVRRAAERKARKQERKADANGFVFSPSSHIDEQPIELPETPIQSPERSDRSEFPSTPISPSQLAANRANSQLSTGPKTSEGKAKSSLNAVKTALTGRTVLLPTDDAIAYQDHVHDFFKELRPIGAREWRSDARSNPTYSAMAVLPSSPNSKRYEIIAGR